MGKFVISNAQSSGVIFNLKAANGETIATSQVYASEATAMKGIESIKNICTDAKIEDQTVENFATVTHPKFEVYKDKGGEFRFRLKARNGEVVAASEGYKKKDSCLNGIESVRKNAPDAEVKKE
ncbi:MAG: YegP family protein [Succinivibrio sp.]|nr:YegP family protein [Succinivibrio sp.]